MLTFLKGRMVDDYNDIAEWLDADLHAEEREESLPPDMFVIGFQEVGSTAAWSSVRDALNRSFACDHFFFCVSFCVMGREYSPRAFNRQHH